MKRNPIGKNVNGEDGFLIANFLEENRNVGKDGTQNRRSKNDLRFITHGFSRSWVRCHRIYFRRLDAYMIYDLAEAVIFALVVVFVIGAIFDDN